MADYLGTLGTDTFNGLNVRNSYFFGFNELTGADHVDGGTARDVIYFDDLQFLTLADFGDVSNIEELDFDDYDDYVEIADRLATSSSGTTTYRFQVNAGGGHDTIDAGDVTSAVAIQINGGEGDDTIWGGGAGSQYNGGEDDDNIHLTGDIEEAQGGGDDDTFHGTTVEFNGDTINGGSGRDDLEVATSGTFSLAMTGVETIDLGNGVNDVTFESASYAGGDGVLAYVIGGDLSDVITVESVDGTAPDGTWEGFELYGGIGVDVLSGGNGDDILDGGADGDILVGGDGNDTFRNVESGDLVSESLDGGIDTIVTARSVYFMPFFTEILDYTGTVALDATGNSMDNTIDGTIYGDTLRGEDGDDTLDGGAGADDLEGGSGDDTYVGVGSGDTVIEAQDGGYDTVETSMTVYTMPDHVEFLDYTGSAALTAIGNTDDNAIIGGAEGDDIRGGRGVDWLIGNEGEDDLFGEGGGDLLMGGSQADTLDGGGGADFMYGDEGSDTYVVDNAGDDVNENLGEGGADAVLASISYTLESHVENLTFTGTGAFTGTGNELANEITGGASADTLTGAAGADALEGAGSLGDYASYTTAALRVIVSLDAAFAADAEGDALGDTFSGMENLKGSDLGDVLRGDGGNNIIDGRVGSDTIRAGGGGDTVYGGGGNDNIRGEGGNDRYVFRNTAEAGTTGDIIGDFTNDALNGNDDSFSFVGSAFGGLPAGALAANRFLADAGGVATTADQRFIYETDTGILRYDSNGTGAAGVTLLATLTGAPGLALGDFTII